MYINLVYLSLQISKWGQYIEPIEMAKFIYHTVVLQMDPVYPDILEKYLGKVFDCENIPKIIANNTMVQISHPINSVIRYPHMYYTSPEGGVRIASEPRNTYVVLEIHVENHG